MKLNTLIQALVGAGCAIASAAALADATARGTGGTRSRLANGDFVHVWKTPGTYAFAVPAGDTVNLRYLIAGGGGSGGSGCGGGGGAGAVKEGTLALEGGTTVTFTVGAGGESALLNGVVGENGQASTLSAGATSVTALGGGAGGSGYWMLGLRPGQFTPRAGASGGGGGTRLVMNTTVAGGAATDGGFAGGASDYIACGGGGGAGTAGGNGSGYRGGDGGAGVASDITGASAWYGGGGGAGGAIMTPVCTDPVPGTDGTGGGGGADGFFYNIAGGSFNGRGARGGSGTVILRYACTAAAQADDTDAAPAADDPGTLAFARIFSDHAILQRNQQLRIWGTAAAGASVTVAFASADATRSVTATAGTDGAWEVTFAALAASAKPGTLTLSDAAGHRVVLSDILVGDVWIADGQSNMDLQLWQCANSHAAAYTNAAMDTTIRERRIERSSAAAAQTEIPADVQIGHA